MPESSLSDRDRITELMESGQIFAQVTEARDRQAILEALISTPGRILSLKTLTQDTLFLDEPAWALRCLFPHFKGISFRKVMRRHYKTAPSRPLEVQKSEHDFTTIQHNENSFTICMMQLWLFAIRHFAYQQPRSKSNRRHSVGSIEEYSLANLALLAARLGFQSNQIGNLRNKNTNRIIEDGFIRSICREEFYNVEDSKLQSVSKQLNGLIRILQRYPEETVHIAQYTTDDPSQEAKHRFNKPAREQYEQQRQYLFLHHIFGPNQPAARFPTSIGVTREILFSFFGNEIEDTDREQIHETHNAPLEVFQETPSELVTQNEEISDIPMEHIIETLREPIAQNEENISEPVAQDEEALTEPNELLQYLGDANVLSGSMSGSQHEQTDVLPDPASRQYPEDIEVTSSYSISAPVDIEPHPDGTPSDPLPQAIGAEDQSHHEPLAAGFEDLTCVAPMESRTFIAGRRRVQEILTIWFQSRKEVIVIFEFDHRAYYKFRLEGGHSLRTTLKDLSRDFVFVIFNDYGLGTPDINATYEEVVKTRLLLAYSRNNPVTKKRADGVELEASMEDLRDYFQKYDINTGKRKRDNGQIVDKRTRLTEEEELQNEDLYEEEL